MYKSSTQKKIEFIHALTKPENFNRLNELHDDKIEEMMQFVISGFYSTRSSWDFNDFTETLRKFDIPHGIDIDSGFDDDDNHYEKFLVYLDIDLRV